MTQVLELPHFSNEGIIPAGLILAEAFDTMSAGGDVPLLVSDLDGVVLDGRTFYSGQSVPLEGEGLLAYQAAEEDGIHIGLATSRGVETLQYLRSDAVGLEVRGPKILNGGELIDVDYAQYRLGHPHFPEYVRKVRADVEGWPGFHPEWEVVKANPRSTDGRVSVSPGGKPWNSDSLTHFWFPNQGDEGNRRVIAEQFVPVFQGHAENHGLDYKNDVAVKGTVQEENGVVMLRLQAAINGTPIGKRMGERVLPRGLVYVADGPGDPSLGEAVIANGGKVLFVGGSPDLTPDINKLKGMASAAVSGPEQLAPAIDFALAHRTRRTARHFSVKKGIAA